MIRYALRYVHIYLVLSLPKVGQTISWIRITHTHMDYADCIQTIKSNIERKGDNLTKTGKRGKKQRLSD